VELVEAGKHHSPEADKPVQKHINNLIERDKNIDCILLACTHYPLLMDKIKEFVPSGIAVISQGDIVAKSLVEYLSKHPNMDEKCSKNSKRQFYTTGNEVDFNSHASVFFGEKVVAKRVKL
jgi:glutamate racemase